MTVFRKEMCQGGAMLAVWALTVSAILAICVLIYPQIGNQVDQVSGSFSQMGDFSTAFGLDRLNLGEFTGFFGVEACNIIGLGGVFFASLLGISSLAREQKDQTAEWLLTHPITRFQVVLEKLLAMYTQILIFILCIAFISLGCMTVIGEFIPMSDLALLMLAHFFLEIESASIAFCISAFLRRTNPGLGLGLGMLFYSVNLIAKLLEETRFLCYFTPFSYADSADILIKGSLSGGYLVSGMAITAAAVLIAFVRYCRKDINC